MSLPTVSVCMVIRDEKPFLNQWFEKVIQYADELVIIDNGSKDGTWEIVQFLKAGPDGGPKIIVEQADPAIIPELGFSFLKNRAAQLATCDWIHSLDADECLDPKQTGLLKPFLKYCKPDVVSVVTRSYKAPDAKVPILDRWDDIIERAAFEDTTHRRIYRNRSNVEWRGYIHEELYQGENNAHAFCQGSDFRHLHFTHYRTWTHDALKRARYSWMLLNAYRHQGLQANTNCWWYTVYVPQHLKDIEHWAGLYEQLKEEGKV